MRSEVGQTVLSSSPPLTKQPVALGSYVRLPSMLLSPAWQKHNAHERQRLRKLTHNTSSNIFSSVLRMSIDPSLLTDG